MLKIHPYVVAFRFTTCSYMMETGQCYHYVKCGTTRMIRFTCRALDLLLSPPTLRWSESHLNVDIIIVLIASLQAVEYHQHRRGSSYARNSHSLFLSASALSSCVAQSLQWDGYYFSVPPLCYHRVCTMLTNVVSVTQWGFKNGLVHILLENIIWSGFVHGYDVLTLELLPSSDFLFDFVKCQRPFLRHPVDRSYDKST